MARSQVQLWSEGDDVRELQNILNQNGYDISEDGIFGSETNSAVKDYQKKNGLGVDGIVGPKTWALLLGGNTTSTPTTTAPSFDYKDFEYDKTFTDNGFSYDKTFTDKGFNYNKTFTDKGFSYNDYKESDLVTQAKNALNAQLAQKPGEYSSQWQAQLDDTINKILNREKFSYDLNGDALYQQYKDKYIQQGKMAMGDAIGQAQAMTGGYGNSYAQSVGQQQYQAQLQNLNDIVPELYQMAYDKYNQEGQDLYNQYSMLGDRENMDYGRYRDSVSDWLAERDYLTGRYDTERGFDYSKYVDDRNFAYGKYSDDRNFNYNQYMDDKNFEYGKYADDRNFRYNQYIDDKNFEYGKYADDRTFNYNQYIDDKNFEYGKYADDKNYAYNEYRNAIEDEQWQKDYELAASKVVGATGGDDTTGGTDNTSDKNPTGGVSTSDIKQMQAIIGVGQDGIWGPKSTAAAGGLSAEEAYKAYQNGTLKKKTDVPTYSSIENDLNTYIKNGASRSNISTYLRNALNEGYISQKEYNKLKDKFLPSGTSGGHYTY